MISILRKILPYLTVVVVLSILYTGSVFLSRSNRNRELSRAAEAKQAAEYSRYKDLFGSGELKILNFYASPGAVKRGDAARICYGVVNATSVRLEPEIESIKPALSHCFQTAPKKTAQYTLTAQDAKGKTVTESLVLTVKP